jgi:hypothetical protein
VRRRTEPNQKKYRLRQRENARREGPFGVPRMRRRQAELKENNRAQDMETFVRVMDRLEITFKNTDFL